MFSRTSLDRLLNEIDSSSVWKDGKIEVVHGLPEQQQTLCLSETRYAASPGGKSRRRRQAAANGIVVSNAFFNRTADTKNIDFLGLIFGLKSKQ